MESRWSGELVDCRVGGYGSSVKKIDFFLGGGVYPMRFGVQREERCGWLELLSSVHVLGRVWLQLSQKDKDGRCCR